MAARSAVWIEAGHDTVHVHIIGSLGQVDGIQRDLEAEGYQVCLAVRAFGDVRPQPDEEGLPVAMQADLTQLRTCAGQAQTHHGVHRDR